MFGCLAWEREAGSRPAPRSVSERHGRHGSSAPPPCLWKPGLAKQTQDTVQLLTATATHRERQTALRSLGWAPGNLRSSFFSALLPTCSWPWTGYVTSLEYRSCTLTLFPLPSHNSHLALHPCSFIFLEIYFSICFIWVISSLFIIYSSAVQPPCNRLSKDQNSVGIWHINIKMSS